MFISKYNSIIMWLVWLNISNKYFPNFFYISRKAIVFENRKIKIILTLFSMQKKMEKLMWRAMYNIMKLFCQAELQWKFKIIDHVFNRNKMNLLFSWISVWKVVLKQTYEYYKKKQNLCIKKWRTSKEKLNQWEDKILLTNHRFREEERFVYFVLRLC